MTDNLLDFTYIWNLLTDFRMKAPPPPELNFMDIRLGIAWLINTDGQTDKANRMDGLRDYATRTKNVMANILPNACEYLLTLRVDIILYQSSLPVLEMPLHKYGPHSIRHVSKYLRQSF